MAVIDTFLKMMVVHRAERLVLGPEETPAVFTGEAETPLSMPVVPASLMERLASELIGSNPSEALGARDPIEGIYQSDDADEFSYTVRMTAAGCRIEMTAAGAGAPDREAPATAEEAARPPDPKTRSAQQLPAPTVSATSPPAGPPDPGVLSVLTQGVQAGASDIFLSSGRPARIRLHGSIRSIDPAIISEDHIMALLPDEARRQELQRTGSVDIGASWNLSDHERRLRINVFRHAHGLAAAIRPIRDRIPSLDELQLPSTLLELCSYPSGLVLVTGASGSGKSTTLAALVDHINRTKARHIITIEDPIEFAHREDQSLIHQREVGSSVESFSAGLRAALRENPDVILLGEMRDLATISAALTAAETGHLVLSTLHTGRATAAINRIIDVFPGHQQGHVRVQLASSLRAVVSQRLIRTADHAGRVPAIEKLVVNPAIASAIRDGHEHHMKSTMQTGADAGMITLERSLATLVGRGTITRDEAFRQADDPPALAKLLE